LTREGLIAQEAYEARKVARRPAFPRKIAGSLLTGLGLGMAGFAASGDIVGPAAYALVGTVLHFLAFGPDPLRDKGAEGIDSFQTDRVARAVDEAEKHLAAMTDAMLRAGDRQLMARLERFQTVARDLFRTVENDPRDLTAARKYLSVYLLGARDATVKFAEIWTRNRDPQARADYEALLTDLEQNFAARTQKLLLDDRSDLTVEIEVLRERLDREGVRTPE
ncbi:MAG: 5-bromo-4-chloroindolyl phosphate hydrolysis family protein, partial [Rhodobacterales bacterium]|nr:5-bromo-4-chloroindolyl phosphate hydrolysis family protein [Rhodobacterales bacterium]MDX5412331.1 5-bromo-4-chloroindolyl phosphate hydrolysis family protein [Rhodobacterales bacterium]